MVEEVGDTPGNAHTLLETLAETFAEMEAKTLGKNRGDASALVNNLTETLAEVEAVGDTRRDSHAVVDTS